jgi:hypothetical protein
VAEVGAHKSCDKELDLEWRGYRKEDEEDGKEAKKEGFGLQVLRREITPIKGWCHDVVVQVVLYGEGS